MTAAGHQPPWPPPTTPQTPSPSPAGRLPRYPDPRPPRPLRSGGPEDEWPVFGWPSSGANPWRTIGITVGVVAVILGLAVVGYFIWLCVGLAQWGSNK